MGDRRRPANRNLSQIALRKYSLSLLLSHRLERAVLYTLFY